MLGDVGPSWCQEQRYGDDDGWNLAYRGVERVGLKSWLPRLLCTSRARIRAPSYLS